MKFFDREREINEILGILDETPDNIYFIYGPINSGKTTLMMEIINRLKDDKKYRIFYYNLRGVRISSYSDFFDIMFEIREDNKFKQMVKDADVLVEGIKFIEKTAKLFNESIILPSDLAKVILSKQKGFDVFRYLERVFREMNKKGLKPVIIIDELQRLKGLKSNGELIDDLFNFFVRLTKELHITHCFCLSSDSLFIEYVYDRAELRGRADYILVDDFDKETALKFMDFLSEDILGRKLSEDEKELIYSYVGGKPKDVYDVIIKLKLGKELKDILEFMLKEEIQKLKYFLEDVKEDDEELYNKIVDALKIFKENYEIQDIKIPKNIREFLVKKNILFLNPIEGTLKPQSFLVWNAIKKLLNGH